MNVNKFLIILSIFVSQNILAAPAVYEIYLSPSGQDTEVVNGVTVNRGYSAAKPAQNLSKALELAKAKRATSDVPVTVYFASGVYYGQQLIWNSSSPLYETTFVPLSGNLGDVIFDGRTDASQTYGSKTYFMSVKPPVGSTVGRATNIVFKKLHIRYYFEAIIFSGVNRNEPAVISPSTPTLAISGNSIYDSKFEKIGNKWAIYIKNGEVESAMAGVRLVNCHSNKFINNQFIEINNAAYDTATNTPKASSAYSGGGLHAFYIAHNSHNNLFEGNRFENHNSGSVIKIRDNSNNNKILRNDFDNVSRPIQIWHCEPHENLNGKLRWIASTVDNPDTDIDEENNKSGCTKHPLKATPEAYECLSYNTVESGNIYRRDKDGVNFSTSNSPFDTVTNLMTGYNYACAPASTDLNFSKESTISNTGYILSSLWPSNVLYFGRCSASSSCVNSANACYAQTGGSSHFLCHANNWSTCDVNNNLDLQYPFDSSPKTKVCMPDEALTDATWTAIPTGQFYIKNYIAGQTKRGFCSTADSCLNGANACYTYLGGSPHLLCAAQAWKTCGLSTVDNAAGNTASLTEGKSTSGYKICKKTADSTDAVWEALPTGKFYVASYTASDWHYQVCSTSNSCVNSSDVCYASNTGSAHTWCVNKEWKACNSSLVGAVAGTKVCTKVTINGVVDYNWK